MEKNVSSISFTNDLFNKVVEAAPSAMIMVDDQGRLVLANLQAEKLFGYERQEFLGLHLEDLVPDRFKKSHPTLRKAFMQNPQTRAMGAGRELYGRRKDGSEVPIEIGLNPLEVNQQIYVLASIIDISERKRAEDKFRLAVEAAPNAMIMVDREGKIVLVNQQTERLFLYNRNELLGNPVEMLVPERFKDQHPHLRKGFVHNPQVRAMGAGRDLFGRKSNGEEVPIEIGLTPVGDKSDVFVLASIIDITERKKNEQLMAAKEAAVEASRIKSQFLATMSHEIRTPLNGIIGFTNLLFNMDMTEAQREYLQGIRVSADSLLGLINDILDLSKIEADKMEIEVTSFNLSQMINDVVSVSSTSAKQKGLWLKAEVDPLLHQWFKSDVAKLKQVLINLLGNAVKFTEHGGITLRAFPIQNHASSHWKRFEVEDTGIGISQEVKSKLFEVFTQGDSSTRRKYGGTGLGLSISKKLVEKLGGRIGVISQPDRGSCFWVEMELPPGEEVKIVHKLQRKQAVPHFANLRVLVAEDNVVNQKVALGLLGQLGLQGQAVGNGFEAIELLNRIHFDLVLMDCHMPEMDGFETTYRLRASTIERVKNVPIIAMTANVMQGDREHCLVAGMNDYISKPIDPAEMERVLRKWLTQQQEETKEDAMNPTGAPASLDFDVDTIDRAVKKLKHDYSLDFARELIQTFLTSTPPILKKIEEGFKQGDFKTVLIESHSVKSSSLLLGMEVLSQKAAKIEWCCQNKIYEGLFEQIEDLLRHYNASAQALVKVGETL